MFDLVSQKLEDQHSYDQQWFMHIYEAEVVKILIVYSMVVQTKIKYINKKKYDG